MVTVKQLDEITNAYLSEIKTCTHTNDGHCMCPAAVASDYLAKVPAMGEVIELLILDLLRCKDIELILQGAVTLGFIIGSRCESLEKIEASKDL